MRNTWEVLQKSGGKIRKLYFFFKNVKKIEKYTRICKKKWIFCWKMSKKSKNIREFATKIGFFLNVKKIEKLFETLEKKLGKIRKLIF